MKSVLLASVIAITAATQASALTLPPTYAPTPTTSTADFQQGVTGSVYLSRKSPFDTTTTPNAPYDVVYGNGGGPSNPYGIAATFLSTAFGGSNGAAGIFTFVDGSPDSYNVLEFSLGGVVTQRYQGTQIFNPTTGGGVHIVTLTGIGAYDSVSFGSIKSNSFEFAALTGVPLPAALPMFGGALLAVGAFGAALKRKSAAASA